MFVLGFQTDTVNLQFMILLFYRCTTQVWGSWWGRILYYSAS